MNKKIITIAEIVFALIFVVLLALFMSTISNKGNSANTQLIDTLESTGGTSVQSYDGRTQKGEAVINAIRNVKTMGDGVKLELDVYTVADATGTAYGYVKNGSTLTKYTSDIGKDTYINSTADFNSHLLYNSNDVVIGIAFVQVDTNGDEVGAKSSGEISANIPTLDKTTTLTIKGA